MQMFEIAFLLLLTVAIIRLFFRPVQARLSHLTVAVVGIFLVILGGIFEGWRWQMMPAYVGFVLLVLASLKRSETKRGWRIAGAILLLILLSLSAFLTHQLPVLSLPAPTGPYGVGTFDYSITDTSRSERFAPESNRELYVEVWYPADKSAVSNYPVRTLFQELYEGDYDLQSFIFGYQRHIPTHSHIQAPVALENQPFPVLLFNHGGNFGFTSQNVLLMEHLASHGYVIFSIAHPYQSLKVNLTGAGTVTTTSDVPSDIDLPLDEMDLSLFSKILEASNSREESSAMRGVLLRLADDYMAQDESAKETFIANAINIEELQPYRHFITEQILEDYLQYSYLYQGASVQYWVEDIQFIANSIADVRAPVAGFADILDSRGFGVFGMSFGGAAAGEFCKVDNRCIAGANLDGTQFGRHWHQPVNAPFLMFYHEAHQGGNNFAYLPASHDFWDYGIKGSTHFDFTDFAFTHPIVKTLGVGGTIDGLRMIEIVNMVQLNFFDHYLKGRPISGELFTDIPEIVIRKH